jgi:hypothetical protein
MSSISSVLWTFHNFASLEFWKGRGHLTHRLSHNLEKERLELFVPLLLLILVLSLLLIHMDPELNRAPDHTRL